MHFLPRARVFWLVLVALFVALHIISRHYYIALNNSGSLPFEMFLIKKGHLPERDDFVSFYFTYDDGTKAIFTKIVAGVAGDRVWSARGYYFVGDESIGRAKSKSKSGKPLTPAPTGIIPENRYFVYSPHRDSYDSRYMDIGNISADDIIGVAYPIF